MFLTLHFLDGTTLQIPFVQAVREAGPHTLETQTYGNESVRQRNVSHYEAHAWTDLEEKESACRSN